MVTWLFLNGRPRLVTMSEGFLQMAVRGAAVGAKVRAETLIAAEPAVTRSAAEKLRIAKKDSSFLYLEEADFVEVEPRDAWRGFARLYVDEHEFSCGSFDTVFADWRKLDSSVPRERVWIVCAVPVAMPDGRLLDTLRDDDLNELHPTNDGVRASSCS